MSLFFRVSGQKLIFFGSGTFHKKEALKARGARFNGADKSWIMELSEENLELARTLGAQGSALSGDDSFNGGASSNKTSASPTNTRIDASVDLQQDIPTQASPLNSKSTSVSASVDGLTVPQLMMEAAQAVATAFPNPVWVIGEIQNLSKRGETAFLELAEGKDAGHATATMTVKTQIWGSQFSYLQRKHGKEKIIEILQDGTKVRFLCRVSVYKDRGQISLTVEDVDPQYSQGLLALQRAELLKKLRTLGLDRKNKDLKISSFPFRVAFISAPDSRAHSDFEHQLTGSKQFPGTLFFIPCPMQGDKVPKEVVRCIAKAQELGVDIIVISRGGGSAADLRWFDGEEIAMSIVQSSVPIVCAIGHHDDRCIAEEICHTRQKTPTAAADFIIELFRTTRQQINEYANTLAFALDREVLQFSRKIQHAELRINESWHSQFSAHYEMLSQLFKSLNHAFEMILFKQQNLFDNFSKSIANVFTQQTMAYRGLLDQLSQKLTYNAETSLRDLQDRLTSLQFQIEKIDPKPWLLNGWTQLFTSQAGEKPLQIRSVEQVEKDMTLSARMVDGVLRLNVLDSTKR
ncbi:MAG: exodeoxyribonuclease VII large subunit [Proteobacteria bacterium]|nr:exodeoxyribonuclease VII large subunit [Pseudomonadota bacterium]